MTFPSIPLAPCIRRSAGCDRRWRTPSRAAVGWWHSSHLAICCRSGVTPWTSAGSLLWSSGPVRPRIPGTRPSCLPMRWHCGGARRWRTSPTPCLLRRPSRGWRSNGWQRWNSRPRRGWHWASTACWPVSSATSWSSIRCGSGYAPRTCSPSTGPGGRPRRWIATASCAAGWPTILAWIQAPALQRVQAPPTLAARPRTNIPAMLTGLVGRTAAVTELRALLDERRLVTLTGPGGVGKTRLALAAAAPSADAFPDGVWLVELAGSATAGARAPADAVMDVLGIRDDSSMGPSVLLAEALRTSRMLLVLDNCEHLVDQAAKLAAQLLQAAPELRILATSREPLMIAGEVVWAVPPLELPGPEPGQQPADLAQFSAVQLFVMRAEASAPGFRLDEGNAQAVAGLCQRLDGIPLALELAATRVRTLGVPELLARLDNRFRLLVTGHRDAPPRQQTLLAVIDWSWELLTEPERLVLRRLAVAADGCGLHAAETICAEDDLDVLGLVSRLVDRSLVVVADGLDGPRYRLLESVAAYGLQRLRQAGEVSPLRLRHRRYYTSLAERAAPHLRGHDQRS